MASEIAAHPSPQPISAARRRLLETVGEAGDLREPVGRQQVHVGGPVEVSLRVVEGVVGIRDPGAGAVGVSESGRVDPVDRGEQVEERADRGEALRPEQALLGGDREAESSLVCVGAGGGDVDQAGGGLLFEPFLCVAGVDAGGRGQLGGGDAVVGRSVLIEAELATQADGDRFEGGEARLEEPFGVRADLGFEVGCGGFGDGHWSALRVGGGTLETDDHDRFVADDMGVVARGDPVHHAGHDVAGRSVAVLDVQKCPDTTYPMCSDLARVGPDDRLDALRPAPPGLERVPADLTAADLHDLDRRAWRAPDLVGVVEVPRSPLLAWLLSSSCRLRRSTAHGTGATLAFVWGRDAARVDAR